MVCIALHCIYSRSLNIAFYGFAVSGFDLVCNRLDMLNVTQNA